jgi:hypothetical protein
MRLEVGQPMASSRCHVPLTCIATRFRLVYERERRAGGPSGPSPGPHHTGSCRPPRGRGAWPPSGIGPPASVLLPGPAPRRRCGPSASGPLSRRAGPAWAAVGRSGRRPVPARAAEHRRSTPNRRQRGRSGQHSTRGEYEHDGQTTTHTARSTRVRYLGQPLQQALDLLRCDLAMLPEAVKVKRNQQ